MLIQIFLILTAKIFNTVAINFHDPDALVTDLKTHCPQLSPAAYSPTCPMGNIISDNGVSEDGALLCSQTKTTVGMTPYRLAHVDDRTETISIVAQLKFTWDIPCDNFGSDDLLIVNYPAAEFWRPKFKLTNSIDDFQFTEVSQIVFWKTNRTTALWQKLNRVDYLNGFESRFEYFARGTLTATCNLQLTSFPFDEQVSKQYCLQDGTKFI